MKNSFNLSRSLLVFSIFFFAANSPALAENRGAEYLVQSGINELDKGNKEGAIRQFQKALMIDQNNTEALDYLSCLGADPDPLADSPIRKKMIVDQANQALAQYEEEVARLDSEVNRMLFRLELARFNEEQDRASYLNDEEFVEKALAKFQAGRGHTMPAVDMIELTDQGRENEPLAGIDANSRQEFEVFLWTDEQPAVSYYDPATDQDKLVEILDHYLSVREDELQTVRDDLIGTQIDLSSTQKDLVDQIIATQQLNDVYAQVLKIVDGRAFYVMEENSYMQFLEEKLDVSRGRLNEKSITVKEQAVLLACLQEELEQSRADISRLLEEREQLLNEVVHEVNILREEDKLK